MIVVVARRAAVEETLRRRWRRGVALVNLLLSSLSQTRGGSAVRERHNQTRMAFLLQGRVEHGWMW